MHDVQTADNVRSSDAAELIPASQRPSISLILPAYNEADVIAEALGEAIVALSQVCTAYEVIVVDDGSSDETAAIVHHAASTNPQIRLIQHSSNQGYGAAIRSGFAAAEKDLLVFTDADCQFDLTELDRFVLLSESYDIVCGYRIDRKDTPLRCLYSKVYNLLVRAFLGTDVRDVDCALKMLHRDLAQKLQIRGDGFLVNSEILTQSRQRGHSVVEVGVSHRPRLLGESTVSVRHIPTVMSSLLRYWWNDVQFPSAQPDRNPEADLEPKPQHEATGALAPFRFGRVSDRWLSFGLLLVAAIFMLTNLGYPLIDRDETRYAEIPREMLATDNWVVPQLNFQTYYDKPPLVYWLCAISYQLFGVGEVSARLVPALAALATLAVTMFFGSRLFGSRISLLTGIVLSLSVGFAFTSRYLLLDGVLALFVTLSLFTAYEAIRASRLRIGWWVASGIFAGLGFLTKGPIAVVLWLPPVVAMAWLSESHARLRWWHYGIVGGVATIIAAPWFYMVHQQDSDFLIEFFYRHNVARFAGEFHAKPFWFFVPVLLVAGHPWSFLTIPYARFLFGRGEAVRSRRSPAIGFLMLWSAWCFTFFSMSSCKLPTYLLPAAPAMALMIGHYLNEILRDSGNSIDHFFAPFWSARMATTATCIAGVGFVFFVIISSGQGTITLFAWALLWAVLLGTALLTTSRVWLTDRYRAHITWGTSTGVAFLFALMVMHHMVPAYSRSQTILGDTSPLVEQLAQETQPAIATIAHEFSEVPYYLNRQNIAHFHQIHDDGIDRFVAENPTCMLVIDSRIGFQTLQEQLPSGSRITQLSERGSAKIYQVKSPGSAPQIAQRDTLSR
ncbi:glycosyltransferase [Stieleria varia]|uniref:Undecaprenyl phosphate-alpha-4-amino-4-deoxy-L-arabinose arabinosyl transferase n=1 Tax=Stieleria varia TaxID=2528005 RepID=A0A5C6AZZ2_9BACT|nr:glycosyltransferase [Stieleria varia]TWU04586.1 Undecaprenyl phosphate-alpha-4-amino-4-deoxy-L-arabinose arabinosyl transferase [Stieleria varia]